VASPARLRGGEATAATIADLRGWAPIAAVQVEYSLLQRTTERDLLPMADAFGLGVMGYSPLAAGLLTPRVAAIPRGARKPVIPG